MKFFTVFNNILLHSGCLSNCCLPWKTECALNSLCWMYLYPSEFWTTCACPEKQSLPWKFSLHWNKDFWGTCACSENIVFPEIFYCIECSFYIQDFWATCAFPEKQSVPWIHCVEYIFFIIQNCEQPALALKTEFALKFFNVLKYFLSFRIFEQLELALKTEFALKFSSRGGGRSPHLVRHWTNCCLKRCQVGSFHQFWTANIQVLSKNCYDHVKPLIQSTKL